MKSTMYIGEVALSEKQISFLRDRMGYTGKLISCDKISFYARSYNFGRVSNNCGLKTLLEIAKKSDTTLVFDWLNLTYTFIAQPNF